MAGRLPIGYRAGLHRMVRLGLAVVPGGVDLRTCLDIGIDMRASQNFIETTLPDFPAYEGWVQATAQHLDFASVARHNADRGDTRLAKVIVEKEYARWDHPVGWGYLVVDLIDWRLVYDQVTGGPIPDWTGPR